VYNIQHNRGRVPVEPVCSLIVGDILLIGVLGVAGFVIYELTQVSIEQHRAWKADRVPRMAACPRRRAGRRRRRRRGATGGSGCHHADRGGPSGSPAAGQPRQRDIPSLLRQSVLSAHR
jgi:hypothetical protein